MSRYLVCGLVASALLLALSGCGQPAAGPAASEVSPVSVTAAAAPTAPPAATLTDAPTSVVQPTTVSTTPTSLPALAQTALAQSAPQATPDGKLVILRGKITGLDTQTSTLNVGAEQIVWNDQTQVFALTKRLPVSWLRVGRTITAQVRKNEHGQLVAERIVLQPTVMPQTGPPPG